MHEIHKWSDIKFRKLKHDPEGLSADVWFGDDIIMTIGYQKGIKIPTKYQLFVKNRITGNEIESDISRAKGGWDAYYTKNEVMHYIESTFLSTCLQPINRAIAAIGFQPHFKHDLLRGAKTRTIRGIEAKGRKCAPGDIVRMYSGLRNINCDLLAEGICTGSAFIHIDTKGYELRCKIGEIPEREGDRNFAQLDGFDGWLDFNEYFRTSPKVQYLDDGTWYFQGYIYVWKLI